jgi:hypothetical protein
MKKEIQGVLFFLILQNLLCIFLVYMGLQSIVSQAIGTILIGGFLYFWLEHEDKIREKLSKYTPSERELMERLENLDRNGWKRGGDKL